MKSIDCMSGQGKLAFGKARMRSRKFTLMELLIVIAIIGILASLLIPVLGKARKRAYETSCLSNLRQVGMATFMYDEEEGFPIKWQKSHITIREYLGLNSNAWECPSDEGNWAYGGGLRVYDGRTTFERNNGTSYHWNEFARADKVGSLNRVSDASRFLLTGSRAVMGTWGGQPIDLFMWHDKGKRWPILYGDGHAKMLRYYKILEIQPMTSREFKYGDSRYTGEEPFYVKEQDN